MNRYTVRVTDEAYSDLNDIYDYIEQELLNPDAAVRIYNSLIEDMRSLGRKAERRIALIF